MFDPKSRNLPKAGNTEAAEQLWAKAVAQVPSLKCMSRGRFRFTLLSAFALWNSWAEKVPFEERSSRTFKARRKFDKHKKRSKENKEDAAAAAGQAAPKRKEKAITRGRMPWVKCMNDYQHGAFDKRLLEMRTDMDRPKYADADPRWFRDNEDLLLAKVRAILPEAGFGEPTHNAKWRCIFMLHKTLVDWVVAGGPPRDEMDIS